MTMISGCSFLLATSTAVSFCLLRMLKLEVDSTITLAIFLLLRAAAMWRAVSPFCTNNRRNISNQLHTNKLYSKLEWDLNPAIHKDTRMQVFKLMVNWRQIWKKNPFVASITFIFDKYLLEWWVYYSLVLEQKNTEAYFHSNIPINLKCCIAKGPWAFQSRYPTIKYRWRCRHFWQLLPSIMYMQY